MAIETELLQKIRNYYVFECATQLTPPSLTDIAEQFDVSIAELRPAYKSGRWEDYRKEESNKLAIARRKVEDELAVSIGIDLAKELTSIFSTRLDVYRTTSNLIDQQLMAKLQAGDLGINALIRLKEIMLREGNQLSNDIRAAKDSINDNSENELESLELSDVFAGLEIVRKVNESRGVVTKPEVDHIQAGRTLFERLAMEDENE